MKLLRRFNYYYWLNWFLQIFGLFPVMKNWFAYTFSQSFSLLLWRGKVLKVLTVTFCLMSECFNQKFWHNYVHSLYMITTFCWNVYSVVYIALFNCSFTYYILLWRTLSATMWYSFLCKEHKHNWKSYLKCVKIFLHYLKKCTFHSRDWKCSEYLTNSYIIKYYKNIHNFGDVLLWESWFLLLQSISIKMC